MGRKAEVGNDENPGTLKRKQKRNPKSGTKKRNEKKVTQRHKQNHGHQRESKEE